MTKIKRFINKLSNVQKVICIILILGFIILLSIGIPTLARYKNRSTIITAPVWDGSIASSYRKGNGTENDPYIISNGSELAYFQKKLTEENYDNTYFALGNDIVLNKGIFNYDETNGIEYILNDQIYYVDEYSNKYYDNVNREGTEIGSVNTLNTLDGFKGDFKGSSYRVYGLYITDETSEELALFTNLEGNIVDLYVENSIVYGGSVTGGIASSANNASLMNILYDGYVVGRNTNLTKNININLTSPVINLQNTETIDYIDLSNNIPFVGSEIISTSITGNYTINGPSGAINSVKINGVTVTNGSFDIDLGSSIIDNVSVATSTDSSEQVTLTFSNLSYNVSYKYGVSGGVVAIANNTTIKNTINKASVYSYSTSGGLVGTTTNLISIDQSYNIGDINSNYVSGGLVGSIEKSENNILVSKSYNTGDMTGFDIGGLFGVIDNNSGNVSISYVFNTSSTNYSIGSVYNTLVNVTNAYYVSAMSPVNNGVINGSFTLTTMSDLQNKGYITNNLLFDEFVDFDDLTSNNQNVWVYELDSLPILFIDDLNNPIASIHASVYTWDNLSYELSPVKLDSNITFSIEETDDLRPHKEVYYYISNSAEPLTSTEISQISSWTSYSDIVQISDEGFYVVYAKIVDYDDNITYINTDLLILDWSGSNVNLNINDNTWLDLRDNLDYVYIDRPEYVTVEATDDLSGIESIKYYVTDQLLNSNDLDSLDNTSWTDYSDGILIDTIGQNIVYVQVIDNCNYVTYANSDYVVLDGYTQNDLIIGRDSSSYLGADPYITDESTITLNMSYSNPSYIDLSGYTHNLMSNILLPLGTKMTLIDNVKKRVYEYEITTDSDIYNYNNSCDIGDMDCEKVATYPFTLFKEIGTGAVDKFFTESDYIDQGTVNEDFTLILTLSNTNINFNYTDVKLYMELHDLTGINTRPTLYSTVKNFDIYYNVSGENTNAGLYLTSDYSGDEIIYNSASQTDISITSGINYKYINGFKITDTTYENKEIGLSIKLVDEYDNTIERQHLKNFIFKIGENEYYPGEDNIVRINLQSGIEDVTKILKIITSENNSNLDEGIYYFKISNYISEDGYYYEELSNNELSIPVNVSDNNFNIEYSFNVTMNNENHIISKNTDVVPVTFNIMQSGFLNSPNIKISLYKKDQLTAYNQDYSIVDLSNYVNDTLNLYESNTYYVSTNPVEHNEFSLNLITANFENTGYKYVFDLYDGTKKVGTIEKYFIVK